MSIQGVIAANRFGLGARPGDVARVSSDPKGWLLGQLTPETELPAPLRSLPSTVDDMSAFFKWVREIAAEAKAHGMDPYKLRPQGAAAAAPGAGMAGAGAMTGGATAGGGMGGDNGFSIEREYVKAFLPRYAVAVKARFDTAVATERPFFERLVHFWTNHFVVSGAKPGAITMPPSFERDVVRPHVTGRFADMLMASSKHPAMLYYLDNYHSIGPDSKVGKDPSLRAPKEQQAFAIPQVAGLNENLAREIMELQTLGVRSGYTQADVTSFARVITGWTIAGPPRVPVYKLVLQGRLNAQGLFEFDDEEHEPGPQTVMGKVYAQTGVDQGEAVLNDLARHPATAHFIAAKLARHFIADDPPPALVERLAQVFRDSDGDLKQVCTALVDSAQAFAPEAHKFKTPEEYVISAARALPALQADPASLLRAYGSMGQTPYNPPGPNGWPDVQAEWLGADAVWKRFEWANQAAQSVATTTMNPLQLGQDVLGDSLSPSTAQAIARAQSPAQGLTLLLASAEFQRR
ncbi:MAG TPA: DUF1800 domain-containing protein [Rhizomicrobium sp.]|jgi:uncharacterized protein (DUF1800 family)|nr:DUF1800 domain-containing protein [Rhizomicrobium sp.]